MQVDFSDKDQIIQEPTGEDPLVYYVPAGEWSRSIGVEILPLYKEYKAKSVTVRFFEEHLARLRSFSDSELVLIIQRYVQTFSNRFSRWNELTAEFPDWLIARLGEKAILESFIDVGWQLRSRNTTSFRWEK